MLALRLILNDKGGKQNCLPFVDSSLGIEIFLKKSLSLPFSLTKKRIYLNTQLKGELADLF